MAIIDEAIAEATQDERFTSWAEEAGRLTAMDYVGHEETTELIDNVMDTYQQYADLFTQ